MKTKRLMRRLLYGESGAAAVGAAVLAALVAVALAANSANLIGGLGAIKNKEIATERVSELREGAERRRAEAQKLAASDPAVSDLLTRHAKELDKAADAIEASADQVFMAEKKSHEGQLPDWVPGHDDFSDEFGLAVDRLTGVEGLGDIPYWITQYKEALRRDDKTREEALSRMLGGRLKGSKEIYRDIAWARLTALYRAHGPQACFTLGGKPTDEESWAVSINQLRRLYADSALASRDDFRKAIEGVTGVPFGQAEVSLAGCAKDHAGEDEQPPAGADRRRPHAKSAGPASGTIKLKLQPSEASAYDLEIIASDVTLNIGEGGEISGRYHIEYKLTGTRLSVPTYIDDAELTGNAQAVGTRGWPKDVNLTAKVHRQALQGGKVFSGEDKTIQDGLYGSLKSLSSGSGEISLKDSAAHWEVAN